MNEKGLTSRVTNSVDTPSRFALLDTRKINLINILEQPSMVYHRKYPSVLPLTLTLGSMEFEVLTSTLYIMSSMHLQSLKLLHPIVKEKVHLQENTLSDLDIGFNVI